ncbi:PREDICTED: uncharacterized protein LOC104602336 [Nelumbo nucifera]|uniref:Uncharacterized protein LOC104602336 n=1 Tax=Nelumbo nucifera TaxID=4432 RepID=A0A1U8AP01_NELNU|nr:PREDICTED: uncharacterized protein LOC104602336 [Nelumbo nucifera]
MGKLQAMARERTCAFCLIAWSSFHFDHSPSRDYLNFLQDEKVVVFEDIKPSAFMGLLFSSSQSEKDSSNAIRCSRKRLRGLLSIWLKAGKILSCSSGSGIWNAVWWHIKRTSEEIWRCSPKLVLA